MLVSHLAFNAKMVAFYFSFLRVCVCARARYLFLKFTQSLRPGLLKKGQLPENSLPGLPRRRAPKTQLQRLLVTLPGM